LDAIVVAKMPDAKEVQQQQGACLQAFHDKPSTVAVAAAAPANSRPMVNAREKQVQVSDSSQSHVDLNTFLEDDTFLQKQKKMLRQLEQRKPSPKRSPTQSTVPPSLADISFRPVPRKKKSGEAKDYAPEWNDKVARQQQPPPQVLQKSQRQAAGDDAPAPATPVVRSTNQETKKWDESSPSSSLQVVCPGCQHVSLTSFLNARDLFCTQCHRVISWDAVRQALSHDQQRCEL